MFRRTALLLLGIACLVPGWAVADDPPLPASVYSQPAEPAANAADGTPAADLSVPPAETAAPDGVPAVDPEAAARAERIVSACLAGLLREPSIAARMRQRVRVGDHSMVGAGLYLQSGLGEEQRFRFESSLAADARSQAPASGDFFTVETLEVCDGASFWTYRRWGENPTEVHRVDVLRVRQRVESISHVSGPDAPAITQHIGGVPRILAWLREWFIFDRAQSAEIDGMPVWLVDGRWNPQQAVRMFPALAPLIDEQRGVPPEALPDGVPWSIRLSIGKRELFPFRIEYFAVPGERPVANPQVEPIGVFELYDVQLGEPVDQTAFIYSPASDAVLDTTEMHLGLVFGIRP
jgi:hypothetical protein